MLGENVRKSTWNGGFETNWYSGWKQTADGSSCTTEYEREAIKQGERYNHVFWRNRCYEVVPLSSCSVHKNTGLPPSKNRISPEPQKFGTVFQQT